MLQRLFKRVVQRSLKRTQNVDVIERNLCGINHVHVILRDIVRRRKRERHSRLNEVCRVPIVVPGVEIQPARCATRVASRFVIFVPKEPNEALNREVGRELKLDNRLELFAATPPLESLRMVISLCASRRNKKNPSENFVT